MELEMKFKVDKDYTDILIQKGYISEPLRHQSDIYFLNGEMINGFYTWLRLRENKIERTYSLDCHRMKALFMAEETEIPLPSIEQVHNMQMILETLGYVPKCTVNKKRLPFKRADVEVVLDEIEGLGSFLEVEIMGDGTDENMARLQSHVLELGLELEQGIRAGYPNLLIASQQGK